jgi:GH24 family phage-related lysozyme (muramidase)
MMNKYSNPRGLLCKQAWLVQTHADLQRHEGFRQYAYPDPLSKLGKKYKGSKEWGYQRGDILLAKYGDDQKDGRPWTVGYGFTRGVTPASSISKELADRKLEQEIVDHVRGLDDLVPEWRTYPPVVQAVLANLIFNLGKYKLTKFHSTLQNFRDRDYERAAGNLQNSLWYRQVGTRSVELVNRLRTGEIESKHKVI